MRHEFAAGVVTVRVVRLEDAEPILDGQAGGHDQEASGEVFAGGMAGRIDRLPSDQHGHDSCLASPGGQFQREAHQCGIGVLVSSGQVVEQAFAALEVRRDLGQPNRALDGFHLTKEWADAAERVVPPVLEQARRFRADLPLGGVKARPATYPHSGALH